MSETNRPLALQQDRLDFAERLIPHAEAGFTSTSLVAYYLETLEQQGYLRCQPHISRGMLLTPAGSALAQQAAGAGPGRQRQTFSRPHEQP